MPMLRIPMVAVASALAIVAFGQHPAHSQSFEIQSGEASGPRTMAGSGNTGTIRAGGSVGAVGGDAVQMFNSDQLLVNDGTVETSGGPAAAVNSQGSAAVIVNNGWILSVGDGSAGVLADGASAYVENNGTISMSGDGDAGIIGAGSNLTVSNNGSITVDGVAAAGIVWESDGLWVGNSGSVVVSGLAAIGIGASGNDVVIDNAGLVQASGEAAIGIGAAFGTNIFISNDGSVVVSGPSAIGILAQGDNVVVDNAGLVRVSDDEAVGIGVASDFAVITNTGSILTEGTDNTALSSVGIGTVVTNSGRIISDQGVAVYFGGADATLNLLARTAIQGPIVFSGNGNTATFGPGLNAVMTFSGAGLPETIRTGGRPFAIDGDTVAVLDITGLASAGAVVQDLTGSVASAIDTHLANRLRTDADHSARAWIAPLGVMRDQAASGALAGFSNALGGVVAGVDADLASDVLAGAFVGAAGGRTSVDGDAQRISHRSFFGGGYLAYDTGARFADVSLTFGTLDESSHRRVANNLVLGGVEMARADYDGTFVSPSLTLGTRLPYGANTLIPSLRLRYAGLFLGGYAETGAADGLAVADRDIHLFEARGQLALAMPPVEARSGVWQTTLRAGIDGMVRNAGDVSATFLGQEIAFADGSRKQALSGFVGAGLSLSSGNGMTFGGDVETSYGSDGAFIAHAQAYLNVAF